MNSERPSRSGHASAKQLAAVATAALPVVMLSSLALAQPASAAELAMAPHPLPLSLSHGPQTASVAASLASNIPAALVAGTVPTTIAPMRIAAPSSYTIAAGDTISGISARYGLNTSTVLSLNHLTAGTVIYPGQKIKLTGTAAAPAHAAAAPKAATSSASSYVIKAGDTIGAIARAHGLSVDSVLSANGLRATSIIYPGQKIVLRGGSAPKAAAPAATTVRPAASSGSYTVVPGDTLSGIAAKHHVSLQTLFSANRLSGSSIIYPGQKISLGGSAAPAAAAPAATHAAAPASGGRYTIVSGDTLSGIAAKHHVSLQSLLSANGLGMTSVIYAGKSLAIPGVSAASTSVTPIQPTQKVPNTFLNYTYPPAVVDQANVNKARLDAAPAPTAAQMKEMIATTAAQMGVDPSLALAFAWQESGFNARAVSPANAIGAMQVIPSAGDWASTLVGRQLNLLNPQDNVTAGVAIIRALLAGSKNTDDAIAGYYQGQSSVAAHGMYADTKAYVASVKALQKTFK